MLQRCFIGLNSTKSFIVTVYTNAVAKVKTVTSVYFVFCSFATMLLTQRLLEHQVMC